LQGIRKISDTFYEIRNKRNVQRLCSKLISQNRTAFASSRLTKFARPQMQPKLKTLPVPLLTHQGPTYFWRLFRGNWT